MKTTLLFACGFLCPLSALLAQDTIKIDAKPGLWEETMTVQVSGLPAMPQIPPETLARMSEAQRKQIESMGSGRTTTVKACITREQLDKGAAFRSSSNSACSVKVTSSAGKIMVHEDCPPDADSRNMKRVSDITIERIDSEHVKGTGTISLSGGPGTPGSGRTMDTKATIMGKWLGADCGDVKPGEAK